MGGLCNETSLPMGGGMMDTQQTAKCGGQREGEADTQKECNEKSFNFNGFFMAWRDRRGYGHILLFSCSFTYMYLYLADDDCGHALHTQI